MTTKFWIRPDQAAEPGGIVTFSHEAALDASVRVTFRKGRTVVAKSEHAPGVHHEVPTGKGLKGTAELLSGTTRLASCIFEVG